MAKRLSMAQLAQEVRDAEAIVTIALPLSTQQEMRIEAFKLILRELLDNEYDRDLSARG
jgi:hypothetical protein